jgi:hypothetical protein
MINVFFDLKCLLLQVLISSFRDICICRKGHNFNEIPSFNSGDVCLQDRFESDVIKVKFHVQ